LSSSTAIVFAEMHVTMPPIVDGASSTAFANAIFKGSSFCIEALAALKIDGISREELGFVFSTRYPNLGAPLPSPVLISSQSLIIFEEFLISQYPQYFSSFLTGHCIARLCKYALIDGNFRTSMSTCFIGAGIVSTSSENNRDLKTIKEP
jgi:hypothetical protein